MKKNGKNEKRHLPKEMPFRIIKEWSYHSESHSRCPWTRSIYRSSLKQRYMGFWQLLQPDAAAGDGWSYTEVLLFWWRFSSCRIRSVWRQTVPSPRQKPGKHNCWHCSHKPGRIHLHMASTPAHTPILWSTVQSLIAVLLLCSAIFSLPLPDGGIQRPVLWYVSRHKPFWS